MVHRRSAGDHACFLIINGSFPYEKILNKSAIILLSLSLLIAAGCSKSNSNPVTLAPEQIPTVMNEGFKQSSGETKELVNNCISASQNQDVTVAFADLQKLSRRNDLTPEQRAIAARAMVTTMTQLRAASEKGNPAAQKLLYQYMSTR